MVSVVLVGIWFALLVYQVYKWMFYKPKNFPPGPPRLPILGAYPYLLLVNYKHLHKAVDWLCKYYKTDMLGLYIAKYPTIVANTSATVREVLNNPAMDGKPALKLAQLRDPEFAIRGIFFTEGALWHEQRRYTLRNLRDFGFGCRHAELESELHDEVLNLINLIKNGPNYEFEKSFHNGDSLLVPDVFVPTFANFFMKVFVNERLPREKQYLLHDAGVRAFSFGRTGDAWGRMFSLSDWPLRLFPKFSEYELLRGMAMNYYNCIKAIVDEQYKTFDRNHERSFLDMYFKKIEDGKNDPNSMYTYEGVVLIAVEVFFAVFVANSTQIQFLLQRFYFQPEILKKCQDEIDKVVGHSRLPNLDDRINLPYMEATIRESFRHEILNPSGAAHSAMTDTTVMGYDIPKGTIAITSLYGAQKDEQVWDQPEVFKPERFLDETGKFAPKLDKILAFGTGKRVCAGETFSKNGLFLVASALVQNFNIELPKNERMPQPSETRTGLFRSPPEYRLRFLSR